MELTQVQNKEATYVFDVDSEVHNQKASADHSDRDRLTFVATVSNIAKSFFYWIWSRMAIRSSPAL
jgi:hypothetical protein